jgi:hypothetical protein
LRSEESSLKSLMIIMKALPKDNVMNKELSKDKLKSL